MCIRNPNAFRWLALSENCEKRLLASSCLSVRPSTCLSVCLSVRMEQLGSHWTDFNENLYSSSFQKSVQKIHVWLKSDKNNGYFTSRFMYINDNISLILRMGNISYIFIEKFNTHFIFLLIYFQQDATIHRLLISGKLLYLFRVVSPPIRSTYNCIYSIWYLSNRYC